MNEKLKAHSPTPIDYREQPLCGKPSEMRYVFYSEPHSLFWGDLWAACGKTQAQANADFLKKAWNAYDSDQEKIKALMEALTEIKEAVEKGQALANNKKTENWVVLRAEAALKLVDRKS